MPQVKNNRQENGVNENEKRNDQINLVTTKIPSLIV